MYRFFLWITVLVFFFPLSVYSADSRGLKRVFTDTKGKTMGYYSGSYALLVGVSDYRRGWPDLKSIPGELKEVEAALRQNGFTVEIVINPDSTRLYDAYRNFINRYGYDKDNRLLFFFSGHGYSRMNGKKGYLVPVDAPDPRKNEKDFLRKALTMSDVLTWSRKMESKHALFLFDSCFSGTIFKTRALPKRPPHISVYTSRPVRQFITAGSEGEEVPAKSVFTPSFVRALRGEGDLNGDKYVTGTELGMYLTEKVIGYNTFQTPQYGKIRDPDLDEGDFVFSTKTVRSAHVKPVRNKRVQEKPVRDKTKSDITLLGKSVYDKPVYEKPIQLKEDLLYKKPDDSGLFGKTGQKYEWRRKGTTYWVYYDGKDMANHTFEWIDNDALVFQKEIRKYLLLENYQNRADNRMRPAKYIQARDNILWRRKGDTFWVYYDGKSLSNHTFAFIDNDALVFQKDVRKYLFLKDYKNRADNQLHQTRQIKTSNNMLWRLKGITFWIYYDGRSISNHTFEWVGADALVFQPDEKKYLLLEGYKYRADNQLRPVRHIKSNNNILWRRQGDTYWVYYDGKGLGNHTFEFRGNDALVFQKDVRKRLVLKNYKNRADNQLRPANYYC